MKSTKKILSVVLCLIFALAAVSSLASCGEKPDTDTNTVTDTSTDTATDTSTDTATDTSTDTATDTSTDTATDTSTDTAPDTEQCAPDSHNYVEKNKREKTCTEDGYIEYECSACGATKKEILKKGHSFNADAYVITVQPTYFLPGVMEYPCDYCDAVEEHLIDPTGKANFEGKEVKEVKNITVTVSGRYNDWVAGAEALIDGNIESDWFTNARNWVGVGINAEIGYDAAKQVGTITVNAEKKINTKFLIFVKVQNKDDASKFDWEKVHESYIGNDKEGEFIITADVNKSVYGVKIQIKDYEDEDKLSGALETVKSVVVSEGGTDVTYNDINWTLPDKTEAKIELSAKEHIACIKWISHDSNRVFAVDKYVDGEWIRVGKYNQDSENKVLEGGKAAYTVDIDDEVEAIRISILKDGMYWESKVYEIFVYALVDSEK